MKTNLFWSSPRISILLLVCLLTGCKKENEHDYWPQGMNGKFVVTLGGYYTDMACYTIDAKETRKVFESGAEDAKWFGDGTGIYIFDQVNYDCNPKFIILTANGTKVKEIEGRAHSEKGLMIKRKN